VALFVRLTAMTQDGEEPVVVNMDNVAWIVGEGEGSRLIFIMGMQTQYAYLVVKEPSDEIGNKVRATGTGKPKAGGF
jgi:hypothetical protein